MNWIDEVRSSLFGSWLLLLRDTSGYREFSQTEAGFWRSFSAIVLIAPLYLYAATVQVEIPDAPAQAQPGLAGAFVGLVLQWIGWPLAMAAIAWWAGLSHAYSRYIIAYNWSSVLVIAALMPPLMLLDIGLIGEGAAMMLSFVLLFVTLYYRWYVALTALETTSAAAVALVIADIVLSVGIGRLVG